MHTNYFLNVSSISKWVVHRWRKLCVNVEQIRLVQMDCQYNVDTVKSHVFICLQALLQWQSITNILKYECVLGHQLTYNRVSSSLAMFLQTQKKKLASGEP